MQGIVPMVNVPFQHNFELFRDPVNCLMTVVPRNEGPFVILPIPSQMRISSVNSMCQSLNDRTQIQVSIAYDFSQEVSPIPHILNLYAFLNISKPYIVDYMF